MNRLTEEEREKIRKFKNVHKDEEGVIIANGPSLKEVDFEKLKKYPTIGMNRIYLLYDKKKFAPTYYCNEDRLEAEQQCEVINNLRGSIMFIPKYLSYCINNNENIIYTNFKRRYFGHKRRSKFSKDFSKCSYLGYTVTYYALQLAYYLGFSKVYIVGLDHNFNVPDNADEVINGNHKDHFTKNYYKGRDKWYAPKIKRMENSYYVAKKVFDAEGRQIINATPKSKLTVFPKVSFDDV